MIDKKKIQDSLSATFDKSNFCLAAIGSSTWQKKAGKARDIYYDHQAGRICLVSTDRLSAFDRHICSIPFKGQVLNQLSSFWFESVSDVMSSHFIDEIDVNAMLVEAREIFSIEVIVRGYLTGVTATSIWKAYEKGERKFFGVTLPDGLHKNSRLPESIITPTTKDKSDKPLHSVDEIIKQDLLSKSEWNEIATCSKKLYQRGCQIALSKGFVLVDTKYEFGKDKQGNIYLCDELHTPDSSRYWSVISHENFLGSQGALEHYDKEFLRVWLEQQAQEKEIDLYDTTKPLPSIPDHVKIEMSARYIELYEKLTGKDFIYLDDSPQERLTKFFQTANQ